MGDDVKPAWRGLNSAEIVQEIRDAEPGDTIEREFTYLPFHSMFIDEAKPHRLHIEIYEIHQVAPFKWLPTDRGTRRIGAVRVALLDEEGTAIDVEETDPAILGGPVVEFTNSLHMHLEELAMSCNEEDIER